MDKRMVTADEAINLLNEDEQIHTYRNSSGILLGADHNREVLIKDIRKWEKTLQIAGDMARKIKHALILKDEVGYLFIETNEEKLNAFDPIDKSAEAVK